MTGLSYKYAFFQGKNVPLEDARVSIMTNALQYGTGVFGGVRGYYNETTKEVSIFRIRDHYKRFLSSIKMLGCKFDYTLDQLVDIHIELVKQNKPTQNCYFRPFAYVGNTSLGPNLGGAELDYALYMIPLNDYIPTNKGLALKVSSFRRVGDNSIPSRGKFSGAYINSAFARKEAHDDGYDEAIFLNEAGNVCEGSAENLFIIRDGVLITPSASEDILEGITRKTIMLLAQKMGIPVVERTIDRSELYVADELFLSGTGCQLAWATSVDKRLIGDGNIGPISQKLREVYFNTVQGNNPDHQDWCTKVAL